MTTQEDNPRKGGDDELKITRFLEHLGGERRLSPHTLAAYGSDLQQLRVFTETKEPFRSLLQLEKPELRNWLHFIALQCSPSTLARKLGSVRAFYRFMVEVGALSHNPATSLRPPKVRKKIPVIVSAESAAELLAGAQGDGSPEALRDCAILEVLYGSGLRVSELSRLDLGDINSEERLLQVHGKGNKERRVPLGSLGIAAINKYLLARHELAHPKTNNLDSKALFLSTRGARLGPRRVQELVARYGAQSTGRSNLHPHLLRHACATHMLEGGADLRAIQDMLGHQTVGTTERYTHLSTRHLAEVYDKAHPMSGRGLSLED